MSDEWILLVDVNPGVAIIGHPPDGTENEAYSFTFTADGGTAPYTWAIIGGSLPDGLGLNGSTGEISGTPITADDFTFTVEATDALGEAASIEFSISIDEGAPLTFYETQVADGATWRWKMDEESGNIVDDINGVELAPSGDPTYEQTGIAQGTSINCDSSDHFGLDLDPVGDFANIGDADSKYSIEWFGRSDNTGTATNTGEYRARFTSFELRGTTSGSGYEIPFNVGMDGGGTFFGRGDLSGGIDRFSAGSINDAQPHHNIAVVDGNTVKLYVDGVLELTDTLVNTTGGVAITASTAFLTIGARRINSGGDDDNYNGELDAVAIYNGVALTGAQVQDHYDKSILGS